MVPNKTAPRRATSIAFGLASLLTWAAASANGRFPSAQYVVVGPGASSSTIVLRTTFGLVTSEDGGKTFHHVCEGALGYGGSAFDPTVALDVDGAVHVGLFDGLVVVSKDRCLFPRRPELTPEFVTDLDHAALGKTLVLVTATGFVERRNYVWRSDDSGKSYKKLGEGKLATHFETVEIAPSNNARLYATALEISPRKVVMFRSDDGGVTLSKLAFPWADAIGAYVAGIDPKAPDRVYVRVLVDTKESDAGPARRSTILVRTDDAGATFVELTRTYALMLGFAISDDGMTLWHGGPDPLDGLFRSKDRGASWEKLGPTAVRCLRQHAGTLYVCGSQDIDHWALARSTDSGKTLVPMLRLADIGGPVTCPADSPMTTVCPGAWAAIRPTLEEPDAGPVDAAADTASSGDALIDAAVDASVEDARDGSAPADAMADVTADASVARHDAGPAAEDLRASGAGCGCGAAQDDRFARTSLLLSIACAAVLIGRRRR